MTFAHVNEPDAVSSSSLQISELVTLFFRSTTLMSCCFMRQIVKKKVGGYLAAAQKNCLLEPGKMPGVNSRPLLMKVSIVETQGVRAHRSWVSAVGVTV